MISTRKSLVLVNLCLIITTTFVVCENEKKACNVNKFIRGFCTVVSDCLLALDNLSKGIPHGLNRCGFTKEPAAEEIICCPPSGMKLRMDFTEPPEQPNLKLNQKYCEEISKSPKAVHHIYGGVNAKEGEFPHMASIGEEGRDGISWVCGAAIISPKFLLTAAHCFVRRNITRIRVGVTRIDDPNARDFNVKNTTVHEKYNYTSRHNDIALIEIDGVLEINDKVFPACLHNDDEEPIEQVITGWGVIEAGDSNVRSQILQKATIQTFDIEECRQFYRSRTFNSREIVDTQICGKSPPGGKIVDACKGDSGAASLTKNEFETYSIVGVVSYGDTCGGKAPGLYTKVSAYVEWIEKNVWGSERSR